MPPSGCFLTLAHKDFKRFKCSFQRYHKVNRGTICHPDEVICTSILQFLHFYEDIRRHRLRLCTQIWPLLQIARHAAGFAGMEKKHGVKLQSAAFRIDCKLPIAMSLPSKKQRQVRGVHIFRISLSFFVA